MTERPNIVGPEYLADLLQKTVKTIRTDVTRRPESLPPRLVIPGTAKLMWVEADVLEWINSFRTQVKKKGRPVNPAYLQSLKG
jgi:predicted DNA-binding transcriptional regulator AlpA